MTKKSSNNGGHEVTKKIMKTIRINESKKVKWIYKFKNKLIVFTYCLKLFLTLSCIIKLFHQTYLIGCLFVCFVFYFFLKVICF